MITGIGFVGSANFSFSSTAKPSSRGICRSDRIRSGTGDSPNLFHRSRDLGKAVSQPQFDAFESRVTELFPLAEAERADGSGSPRSSACP
jgi:hypothetical protein